MTPAAIDKYEILESLGKGSMGVVYKARDPEIGRLVAIKTLRNVYLGGEGVETEALKRFRQESRSAGRLRHPNIVTIFEAGRGEDGSPYIVMEFIEGKSLEQIIAERAPLAPQEALHYLAQVASALDYAHSQNVIHRDIKPSNVIVDAYFKPHLLDFGVAKLSDTSLTPAGTVVGTPSYMSPEQIKGEELRGSSDLFALAVMTFELFTGSRPFPGKDFTTVVNNIIHKDPLPFQEIGVSLPPELETVLRRGLAKDWRDRPKSVLQFVTEVSQVFSLPVDSMGLIGGLRAEMLHTTGTLVAARPVIAATPPNMVAAHAATSADNLQAASGAVGNALLQPAQVGTRSVPVQELAGVRTDRPNDSANDKPPAITAPLPNESSKAGRGMPMGLILFLAGVLIVGGGAGWMLMRGGGLNLPEFSRSTEEESESEQITDDSSADHTADQTVENKPLVAAIDSTTERTVPNTGTPPTTTKNAEEAQTLPVVDRTSATLPQKPAVGYDTITPGIVATLTDSELLYVLDDPTVSEKTLRVALEDAGRRAGSEITKRLIVLSGHSSFIVRIDALKALAKDSHKNSPETLKVVLQRLADEDFLVRGFAAKLMAQLGGSSELPALESQLAKEENDKVRAVLQQAIDKIRRGEVNG